MADNNSCDSKDPEIEEKDESKPENNNGAKDEGNTNSSNLKTRDACLSKRRVTYIFSGEYVQRCDSLSRIPSRASMIHKLIECFGLLKYVKICPPREATMIEIMAFHSEGYLDCLKKVSEQEDEEAYEEEAELYGLAYDCPGQFGIYKCAVLIAGGTIAAAESLINNDAEVAINWFGGWHHAKRDSASGFCYINDIVLGITKLRERFHRVVYVDLDLHHGDGVEDAFCSTAKVLTVSFHKYTPGFFPGTGSIEDIGIGRGKYYSVNVPLLDGLHDPELVTLFTRIMSNIKNRFHPEAVVCQCGADGLAGDPMDSFNLTHMSLGHCVKFLLDWNLPLLLVGGGGYNYCNTAKCWTFLTSLVVGKKLPLDIPDHEYFMKYGPSYEMSINIGNRKDYNAKGYLTKVYQDVMKNLENIS